MSSRRCSRRPPRPACLSPSSVAARTWWSADAGVRGVVIRLQLTSISQPAADRVRAEAGVTINGLVRWTIGRGLAGLEAWAGTPGTVGGAIYGNAHLGGRKSATCPRRRAGDAGRAARDGVTRRDAVRVRHEPAAGDARGRSSGPSSRPRPATPDALRARARESLAYRKRTQPLAHAERRMHLPESRPGARSRCRPACPPRPARSSIARGSRGIASAARSISAAHANFIVNDGHRDRRGHPRAHRAARPPVRERFGVELRDEVVYLGTF